MAQTLDEILQDASRSIAKGVVTGEWAIIDTKAAIKAWAKELVGSDEPVKSQDPAPSGIPKLTRNALRAELRTKIDAA